MCVNITRRYSKDTRGFNNPMTSLLIKQNNTEIGLVVYYVLSLLLPYWYHCWQADTKCRKNPTYMTILLIEKNKLSTLYIILTLISDACACTITHVVTRNSKWTVTFIHEITIYELRHMLYRVYSFIILYPQQKSVINGHAYCLCYIHIQNISVRITHHRLIAKW